MLAGCWLTCGFCGDDRMVQIEVRRLSTEPLEMEVEVTERDKPVVLRFWSTHLEPRVRQLSQRVP